MKFDATRLLAEIRSRGIAIGAENGRIWFEPRSAVTPELVGSMREHKNELLTLLGCPRTRPSSMRPRCPYHIDRASWIDSRAPSRPGWILTTCRLCGGFIGYRPEKTK